MRTKGTAIRSATIQSVTMSLAFFIMKSASFSNIGTGGLRVEIDVPLRLARQDRPMELPAYEGEVSEEKD